jgi:hypothetical protein
MRKDLLLNENYEIQIANADFVIGQSDEQHVECLVITEKGQIKFSPASGFGLYSRLKQRLQNTQQFVRELKIELDADGYTNAEIDISKGIENTNIEI